MLDSDGIVGTYRYRPLIRSVIGKQRAAIKPREHIVARPFVVYGTGCGESVEALCRLERVRFYRPVGLYGLGWLPRAFCQLSGVGRAVLGCWFEAKIESGGLRSYPEFLARIDEVSIENLRYPYYRGASLRGPSMGELMA